MKILFVSHGYHPRLGGIETQLRMIAHNLARRHEIVVAARSLKDNSSHASSPVSKNQTHAVPTNDAGLLDGAPEVGAPSPRRLSLPRRAARKLVRISKEVRRQAFLPKYRDYVDGEVSVVALNDTWFDGIRNLSYAMRRVLEGFKDVDHLYRHALRRHVPQLRRLMKDVDIVHCVTKNYLGRAAAEAARAEGRPFAITPYVHPGYGGHDSRSVAAYKQADAVFALLDTDADHLVDLGVPRERIRIQGVTPLLPPTIDPVGFRGRYGIGEDPLVLFVGRLASYKGFEALLDAAPIVWKVIPEAHFLFAGPPGRPDSTQVFDEVMAPRIRYLGTVSEQEKADALSACDLVCMPSEKEILPAVYLEAWSYGKPVLGGTAHGLRELIEGNGAGLVVSRDPAEVACRLIELLRDEPRRRQMGERGRALVEEHYAEDALVGRLESMYEDLLRHRTGEAPA